MSTTTTTPPPGVWHYLSEDIRPRRAKKYTTIVEIAETTCIQQGDASLCASLFTDTAGSVNKIHTRSFQEYSFPPSKYVQTYEMNVNVLCSSKAKNVQDLQTLYFKAHTMKQILQSLNKHNRLIKFFCIYLQICFATMFPWWALCHWLFQNIFHLHESKWMEFCFKW